MTSIVVPSPDLYLREEAIRGGMDLLFFANTRHLQRADEKLAALGLGRAHHRVLYFVQRKPGLPISGLLSILAITKQSLKRVSRDLTERGLIEWQQGQADRRQRLLRLTVAGAALERELFEQLHGNMAQAYAAAGGQAERGFWTVLQHLIGEEGRQQFQAFQHCKEARAILPRIVCLPVHWRTRMTLRVSVGVARRNSRRSDCRCRRRAS